MRRRILVLVVFALAIPTVWLQGPAAGERSAPLMLGDGQTKDIFELSARFDAATARLFGSGTEWYSPGSEIFRLDRRGAHRVQIVYDGTAIVEAVDARTFRTDATRAVLRALAERHDIFTAPATVAIQAYLGIEHFPDLSVTPEDGGRAFDVDWHYVGDSSDTHIRYRVDVRSRQSVAAARGSGLLRLPKGPLVGGFRQSPAGAPPHFGERAYWFGSRFAGARAVSTLEQWGYDPLGGQAALQTPPEYTAVYRLPRSTFPGGGQFPDESGTIAPGIGNILPIDILVHTQQLDRPAPPHLAPGAARARRMTLASGEHATVYVEGYTQGGRSGVRADIVLGHTVCFVEGLLSETTFLRLVPTLRLVRR
jgi:hypothetical protein